MSKNIWIIDHYSSEPKYGGISRQYDFANELSQRGYNVVVISSSFSHFTHNFISQDNQFDSEISEKVHYIYLKTTPYESNRGITRMRNIWSFFVQVNKRKASIARKYGTPDVVTGCSVHPFAWLAAYKISRKYKCRFCIEVRDFWPGIWVWGKEKSKYNPMVLFFGFLEKWAYKTADRIIYSMKYGDRYICDEMGIDRKKTFLIGQPMDCNRYDKNAGEKAHLIPQDIKNFISDSFVCVFTGYYMKYEGVYTMLQAAQILSQLGLPIKMVFVGSGQEAEGMKTFVKDHNLNNVFIGDRISKEAIPALLRKCDICMAHLQVEGHEGIYKYGVSKNKVIEYLYSGACTLYGFHDKNDDVAECKGGYVYTPFCAQDLANLIMKVYNMDSDEKKAFGEQGKSFIIENHKVQVLTNKLEKVLFCD